jgi:tRNA A37 threonylcarbamoyltransferase TsaD
MKLHDFVHMHEINTKPSMGSGIVALQTAAAGISYDWDFPLVACLHDTRHFFGGFWVNNGNGESIDI